jgi:hypothetical protein
MNSWTAKQPTITLTGNNLDLYNSYIFLLCYERDSAGTKLKLLLHVRNKLTGFLLAEKVLKTRFEDEVSFSDRMEVGHIIAAIPQSNKIVVGACKKYFETFS